MKLKSTIAVATIAILMSTGAYAQSAFSGSIGIEYMHAPDDGFDYQAQLNGSVAYAFSPKLSVQVDLGTVYYESNSDATYTYGIHGIYSINDAWDVGVFYASDDEGYDDAGIEVAYNGAGPLNVEAFLGMEDLSASPPYYVAGVEVGYSLAAIGSMPGGINVYAGSTYVFNDDGSVNLPSYYVGVKANVWNNLELNLRAANMEDGDYHYFTVGLSYAFGGGTTFAARDFYSSFPGY